MNQSPLHKTDRELLEDLYVSIHGNGKRGIITRLLHLEWFAVVVMFLLGIWINGKLR